MIKGDNLKFKRDLFFIFISVVVSIFIYQSQIIDSFLAGLPQQGLITAFIGGFFFTSAFTTGPALIFLIKLTQFHNIYIVSMLGASGAVVGDTIIFYFVRDRLLNDLAILIKKNKYNRFKHFLKSKIIRFSLAMVGGLLISLPLFPDETALALIGISKVSTKVFIIISFAFNLLAIYAFSLGSLYLI